MGNDIIPLRFFHVFREYLLDAVQLPEAFLSILKQQILAAVDHQCSDKLVILQSQRYRFFQKLSGGKIALLFVKTNRVIRHLIQLIEQYILRCIEQTVEGRPADPGDPVDIRNSNGLQRCCPQALLQPGSNLCSRSLRSSIRFDVIHIFPLLYYFYKTYCIIFFFMIQCKCMICLKNGIFTHVIYATII